jgi:cyclohexyl-isocyanide hydratase
MAKLRGDVAAQLTQLAMEYDPQPPLRSGSPKTADPRTIHQTMTVMASEMQKLATRRARFCLVWFRNGTGLWRLFNASEHW